MGSHVISGCAMSATLKNCSHTRYVHMLAQIVICMERWGVNGCRSPQALRSFSQKSPTLPLFFFSVAVPTRNSLLADWVSCCVWAALLLLCWCDNIRHSGFLLVIFTVRGIRKNKEISTISFLPLLLIANPWTEGIVLCWAVITNVQRTDRYKLQLAAGNCQVKACRYHLVPQCQP